MSRIYRAGLFDGPATGLGLTKRMVGGPRTGTRVAVPENVTVIRGPVSVFDDETLRIVPGWPQDREYVKVRRRSGEVVFEWHRRGWEPPMVRVIKETVSAAADRMGRAR